MAAISLHPAFSHTPLRIRQRRSRLGRVAGLWRETVNTVRGMLLPLANHAEQLGPHIARDLGLD